MLGVCEEETPPYRMRTSPYQRMEDGFVQVSTIPSVFLTGPRPSNIEVTVRVERGRRN